MDGNQIFLKNVKDMLAEKGENFVDLAKHIGVSSSAVSQWFSNMTFPRRKAQEKIAEYLGTTVSDLFNGIKCLSNLITLNESNDVPIGEIFYFEVDDNDSMLPIFSKGDIVKVRRQSDVEDGDFVIVFIDGEYLIREFQRSSKGIMFLPQHPAYVPHWFAFDDEQLISGKVVIIGKIVELVKKFN